MFTFWLETVLVGDVIDQILDAIGAGVGVRSSDVVVLGFGACVDEFSGFVGGDAVAGFVAAEMVSVRKEERLIKNWIQYPNLYPSTPILSNSLLTTVASLSLPLTEAAKATDAKQAKAMICEDVELVVGEALNC